MNAFLIAAASAGMFAGVIAWEISSAPRADVNQPRSAPHVLGGSGSPAPPEDHVRTWANTVLARPVFSPDRRPAADAVGITAADTPGLPRLAGILVGPFGRSAIFAAEGRKPIVVQEGGRVAAYRVESIEAAQVRLLGPNGAQVVHPTFQVSPANTAAANMPARRNGPAAQPR